MNYKKVILLSLLFAIYSLMTFAQKQKNNEKFNSFLENYYQEGLLFHPISATARGDNRFNDIILNDISKEYIAEIRKYRLKSQKALYGFKRSKLNTEDKVSYDIVELQLNQALEEDKFHFEYMPFDQKSGLPISFPSMGSGKGIQPFKTIEDYKNWLKRIDGFTVWAETAIGNFDKGIASGIVLPKALVNRMIPQLKAQTNPDSAKNIFYGPVKNFPLGFTNAERTELFEGYKAAINEKIIPTYKKLSNYLSETYIQHARENSGFNALPNGAEMYKYRVALYTTTDDSPEEIHQRGLNEVDRISSEIFQLKEAIGFKGSLEEFYHFSLSDPKFFPFKTDEEILDAFRAILPQIQPKLNLLFNIIPKSPFEVHAVEKFKAASTAANYQRGAEDGSRPGFFNVPIVNAEEYSRLGMENLFLHEAIPGHHFQLSLQQENPNSPKIKKFASYSVFSEGWALYVESLGEELGLYTDPYQKLAAYKSELFRALRLVVDTGLHTGLMDREETIKYLMEKGGRSEQSSTSETERYMSNPGQALSYKTGELKIKELKSRYQKKLGEKFNIRDFHDAVLTVGSVPLNVFERYMEDWSEKQLALK
jgi:uncharacterized protein (DUF885 family)